MTREDVIRMARKAGSLIETAQEKDLIWLEDFAKLVAQHTLSNIDPSKFMSYQEGMEAGRLAEREACAKVCDDRVTAYQYATDVWAQEHIDEARHLAKAIRARGQA
jgi:predicted acylesterase/phospholipase RssA